MLPYPGGLGGREKENKIKKEREKVWETPWETKIRF